MASILPTILNQVEEYQDISVNFQASLAPNETLNEIKIISNNFPGSIIVQGASFSGSFDDIFSLGPNAIKYRQSDLYKTTDRFSEVPDNADIYEYIAPESLVRDFNCQVELTYTVTETGESGSTSAIQSISKSYTQRVYGNYGKFAEQLLEKINASINV